MEKNTLKNPSKYGKHIQFQLLLALQKQNAKTNKFILVNTGNIGGSKNETKKIKTKL